MKKEVKEKTIYKAKSYLKRFYILNFTQSQLTVQHDEVQSEGWTNK